MEDTKDDIAVVGIGCHFPGGEGLDSFWRVLSEGKNCVVEIPKERFDTTSWYDADGNKPGKTQTTRAALIKEFDEFDHRLFGIIETEADLMDPQQKLLLQCTYRTLEDAGISMESISGSRTGVYIGLMNKDYEMIQNTSSTTISHYSSTGTATSMAANRISFVFNLTGPSFVIDSACSSSLVALHLACQAIQKGDCEMALCGGVSCIIEPGVFVALSKAKMISPGGTSRPFSSEADGYGRGEGCGVVLLKPLKNAIKDYNKVWGIISKTAVNQDGRSVTPVTKPSMTQQQELLQRMYSESDVARVQYIEAHGTGTTAGDLTEAGSISNVIAKAKSAGSAKLRIGSVKGNIGHAESAAGVAGLIKVLLMMKHQTIVASLFYSEDSASIDAKALGFRIPVKAERWSVDGSSERVAGVNSFGFGGTNAHAIVKESQQTDAPTQVAKGRPKLFLVSAASEKSLYLSIADARQKLSGDETVDLQALSYTSACGRSHSRHKYRKTFVASSLLDLNHQLASSLKIKTESTRADIQLGFVFCGNGVAYKGMCKQLLREVPVFWDKVMKVESILQRNAAASRIGKWLNGEDEDDDISTPSVVQPLLFAVQVGIVAVLKHWGVTPDIVLGHSFGEVAAAHCSGLLSLEDAVKVLHLRSTFQNKVTGGKMLLVGNVPVEEVLEILPDFSGKVCVAAFNSPQSCTLSGDADAVDSLQDKLRTVFSDRNLFLHVLGVPAAYHSHMMDPILSDIENSIDLLKAEKKQCKLFSTVTGRSYCDGDFSTGRYWARNIREPVLFEQALRAVAKDVKPQRDVVFVEIGPRRTLQRNIRETLGNSTVVLPTIQPGSSFDAVMSTLGKLFELGVNVDWHQVYRGFETLPTTLPIYQFDYTKKEVKFNTVRRVDRSTSFSSHGVLSQIPCGDQEYKFTLSLDTASYLWEHKNNGVPIVPGALYVELAYASVMANLRPKKPVSLLQVSINFERPFTLISNCHQLRVKLEHLENEASFKIQSSVATHASGTYRCTDGSLEEPNICPDIVFQRCTVILKKNELYLFLCQAGFEYGPVFKQLDAVHFGDEFREAVTMVQLPDEILKQLHEHFIHPVLLDYFFQMTAAVATRKQRARPGFPSAIGSVRISGPLQEKMVMYLRATEETPNNLEVCGSFSTPEGRVLVELKRVRISFLGSTTKVQSCFYHNELVAIPSDSDFQNCHIKAMVFEDKLGIAEGLRPYLHTESVLVENRKCWTADQLEKAVLHLCSTNVEMENVLFLWGVEDLSHLSPEKMLESLVTCCELFCRIVLALKDSNRSFTVHVITHRSSETTVDRISPGFVLSGLTRACAAEMVDISFQLIDLASVTGEDIMALVHVIRTCNLQEVIINKGKVLKARIERTAMSGGGLRDGDLANLSNFFLQTSDPYKMIHLSATKCDPNVNVPEKSVEIRLTNMCVHSCDYFPVTTSHWKHGRTLYWNDYASDHHQVLSLDFSGVVSAVGKHVSSLRLGDHIASCYPVAAAKMVVIPESACYNTKRFVFLKETPCVSFFILAWEVLQRVLSGVKHQHRKLVIVASNSASSLVKVLALTANRSGWNVSVSAHFSSHPLHFHQSHAVVFLPPFDNPWHDMNDSSGHERHFIFVCSNHNSPTIPANIFALQNAHVHVHHLDLAKVLQRANLQAWNKSMSDWLLSLGLDRVPLKKDIIQLPRTDELQTTTNTDSYFSLTTVQQAVLEQRDSNCQTSNIPLQSKPGQLFKHGSVYIVTGGLSGLGLETVKFIAHNGGSCIATLSRSSLSNERQFEMEFLQRQYGARVINVQCDISVSMQVADAISKIEEAFPSSPIRGVFHSAAVLHDAFIKNLDKSLFRKVLQPKVMGAINLHHATLHRDLDFFVCYSSISSFIGNPSQSNYAAANSFLDMFCHYRRNLGLTGQSINWGPLNVGLLLNKDHFQKFLEAKGMMVMDVRDIHEALEKTLTLNRPQQVICKFNFKNLKNHVLSQNVSLRDRLAALVRIGLKGDVSIAKDIELVPSPHPHGNARSIVRDISGVSEDDLNEDTSLHALGIDSMLAMTLQNKIFQETGVNVPLVKILDPNVTLATLESLIINNK